MYIDDTFNVQFVNNNCTLMIPVMYIDDTFNVHFVNNNCTLMIPLMYIDDTVCFMYIECALRSH